MAKAQRCQRRGLWSPRAAGLEGQAVHTDLPGAGEEEQPLSRDPQHPQIQSWDRHLRINRGKVLLCLRLAPSLPRREKTQSVVMENFGKNE